MYCVNVHALLQQEDIHVMNDISELLSCIVRGRKTREPDIGSYCITVLYIDWQTFAGALLVTAAVIKHGCRAVVCVSQT